MAINPGAAEFPHRQIAAELRERIRRGDWQPGERLPSIPAMADMFGVAKQTVQRTVDQLRVEGVLVPGGRGRGHVTRTPGGVRTAAVPGGGGGPRQAVYLRDRHDQRPATQ